MNYQWFETDRLRTLNDLEPEKTAVQRSEHKWKDKILRALNLFG